MKYKQNQLEKAYCQKQNQQKLIQIGFLIIWNLVFLTQSLYYFKLNYFIPISFLSTCLCFGLVYYYPKIIQIIFFTTNIVNSVLFSITIYDIVQSTSTDEGNWLYFYFHIQLIFNITLTKSFNFIINSFSTVVCFIIIWWFQQLKFTWMMLYLCFVIISFDYLYQFNSRRQYYKRQKEKEWREIIHQIIPIKILVSDFDNRTMRLNLYDCSSAAQSYIKQKEEDEDKYAKFLERVVLNIESSKIKFKQFQEFENLKKYLTHRFIMIDDFIKKNEKQIIQNVSNRIRVATKDIRKQFTFQQEKYDKKIKEMSKQKSKIDKKSEFDIMALELAQLDEMEGYYYLDEGDTDPTKRKKVKVKVAYYSVQNSKPLLVISIEDESLREDIEFYKEEKQKSDQFIINMLENYRTTLIKNLSFFNQGWIVVRANFEEIFRNSLVLVNKSYVVYDYFLFLRIRRLYKGVSHQEQLGLIKCDPFNITSMLKSMIEIFHNIDVVCELEDEMEIYNDEKRIKQVFISLFTNCLQIAASAIKINIYESYLNEIKVININIAFYKEEDNPLQGILDGTDSPYVNQIELVVLQEIIRCIGPFDLKANTAPNGSSEIEFAIYSDLSRFKKIFNIQDQDSTDLSKNQILHKGTNRKSMNFKADQFQRKNRKPNKTFYDLKNFNQMESIVGIPRGSKLVSSEVRNKLQAFLTLKDNRCNLDDDDDDDDDDEDENIIQENDNDNEDGCKSKSENTKVQEESNSVKSGRKGENLYTEEQEMDESSSGRGRNLNKSQMMYPIKTSNLDIENNMTYKTVEQDEESSKHSRTTRSRGVNLLDERRTQNGRSSNRLGSQGVSDKKQTSNGNDSISTGSKRNPVSSIATKDKDPLPFIPKKFTSSFTTLRQNTLDDLEVSERKQLIYRQSSRIKSQKHSGGGLQQCDNLRSLKSLNQNHSYTIHQDISRSERNLKALITQSQISIFESSRYKDDKNKIGTNQNDVSSNQTFKYDEDNEDNELNACNITFQIDKSELDINDFTPRLK